jgi:hypothetical protein
MSAIRGVQAKYDEAYAQYVEDYFVQYNEEVCHIRKS